MNEAVLALLRRPWEAIQGNALSAQLLRGGIGIVVVRAVGMGLSLAMTLLLARVLGPQGYGVYSYVFALVGMMAIPAQFGLPNLVLRETARAQAREDWAALKGIWRWAGTVAGALSLLLAAMGMLVAWGLAERFTEGQIATFAWGLGLVPVLVLGRLCGAALRGLRHVVPGQVPDKVLRPGLLVTFVLAVVSIGSNHSFTPSLAMGLHALAASFAFVVGALMLQRVRPQKIVHTQARYQHRSWAMATIPMGLTSGMMLINRQADILLLGLFVEPEQVGIYRIAVQGSLLVSFGLEAVNKVVAPHFTRLYNQGNYHQLQRLATASARGALAVALPATVIFALFGDWILWSAVGAEYVGGMVPLAILALGQMVNAGMGSVGLLLNMTDHEAVVTRTLVLVVVLNIAANLVLIPFWGMIGAATATAATFTVWNSLLAGSLKKRLGLNSTAFGRRKV